MSLSGILAKPLPPPHIVLLWFSEKRARFNHAVETLADWVLLGTQAGRFDYKLGESESGTCHPGDFVLCPPGVALAREIRETLDFYTIRFRWKMTEPDGWGGLWTMRDGLRFNSTLAYLRRCRDAADQASVKAWENHLLTDLLSQLTHEKQEASNTARSEPDRLMLRTEEYLRTDLAQSAPLEDLAETLRLSPFQLSRRFRAAFGVSPSLYRTRLRIQQARRLLLETSWTTDRIAEACGFENAFYFSRVFARQTGQAPREFRKEHRV